MNILRAYTHLFVCVCAKEMHEKKIKQHTFLFYKSDGRRYHTDFSGKIVVFRLQTKETSITNDKYNNKQQCQCALRTVRMFFDKPFQAGFKLRQANDCCFDGWLLLLFSLLFLDLNSKRFIQV